MAITEFSSALNQVATERGISVESVLDTIKLALASAYKKDYSETEEIELEEIEVELDPNTGAAKILRDGKDITPAGFGRIAAQTAKQVILQKIRETEKEVVLEEFRAKIGTIARGTIFRVEGNVVVLDLGKAHGILPISEQVDSENYRLNQRLKVLIKDVRKTGKGSEIIVSRSDPEFILKLFEQEVPEITSEVVKIEAIAREAGSRTKMAVSSTDDKIDPVGSCVGQKGVRVQSIISELFGEKIDIVPFSASIEKFIAASLSPAKVTEVEVDFDEKSAHVSVPEDQLSLAIGKEGQNVRLAHKLTKWKIDIKGAANIFSDTFDDDVDSSDDEVSSGNVWGVTVEDEPVEEVDTEVTSEDAEVADVESADAEGSVESEDSAAEDVTNEESVEETETSEEDDSKAESDDDSVEQENEESEDVDEDDSEKEEK